MKILVPTKRVIDPDHPVVIRNGIEVDAAAAPTMINPFDAIALEEAVRIRERLDREVEIVSVGIGVREIEIELRTTLAMGADRSILVEFNPSPLPPTGAHFGSPASANEASASNATFWRAADSALPSPMPAQRNSVDRVRAGKSSSAGRLSSRVQMELDAWNVARTLQWIVARESPNLVLMGKQAIDNDSNQVGQFLAALLSWPQATFASRIEVLDQRLRVWRETDLGIERLLVDLPAVVTADLRLNEPRYASLPAIIKAKSKPMEIVGWHSLQLELQPQIELLQLRTICSDRNCHRCSDASELWHHLRELAIVKTMVGNTSCES